MHNIHTVACIYTDVLLKLKLELDEYFYTKQKHPRCKKGEAKSEAPKIIRFI